MEIVRIFGDNLLSIKYETSEDDEFYKAFSNWTDAEFLENFFEKHKSDLQSGHWGSITVEKAVLKTSKVALRLEKTFRKLEKAKETGRIKILQSLFVPLNDTHIHNEEFSKSKVRRSWIRLYGLRIDASSYIITGGTIKLTATMNEREHTNIELKKLNEVKGFLLSQGICDIEGVTAEIDN